VLVRLQWHLGRAVRGPYPRPADLDPAAAERHLTVIVTVPERGPLGVPLTLRADDLVELVLEHLAQHTQPDSDAQREQSFLRGPDQLTERVLHALREHGLIVGRLRDRYVATHGGSSFGSWRIAHHAPTRSGRAGGTAVTSNFYTHRDNLSRQVSLTCHEAASRSGTAPNLGARLASIRR
jgi:hypothetical protein